MTTNDACPSTAELQQMLIADAVTAEDGARESHLATCARCQQRLAELAGEDLLRNVLQGEVRRGASLPGNVARGDSTDDGAIGRDKRSSTPALSRVIAHLQAMDAASPLANTQRLTNDTGLQRLGKYIIRRKLGEGGMGIVYEAHDPTLHRDVAIKVLRATSDDTTLARERFQREVRAVAALKHDHIVTIFTVEEDSDTPYFVMELIQGPSLADRLAGGQPLPFGDVLRMAREAAAALAVAHHQHVIHRDIKPGNLLFEAKTGRVKLADFGLARSMPDPSLTSTGVVVGTPEFMAPEQIECGEFSVQSDLFSLGAVLYAAASGKSPFQSSSVVTTLRKVCDQQVPSLHTVNPAVPETFSGIVQRLMQKVPARRYASAAELLDALRHLTDDPVTNVVPLPLAPTSPPHPSTAPLRRFFTARSFLSLATLVLVSLATAGYMRRDPANDPPASTPNAIPDVPARADSRMQLPFRIVGEDRAFASLKEAIEAAGPGMKIELLDEGPFDTPELTIAADSLTIAAAAGLSSRPVLAIQPQDAELPGLMASGALTLEGIELRLERPMSDLVEEPARDHSATVRALGNLTIRNCRIVTTASRTCVSVVGGELRVQRSHLETAEGVCVWWRPRFADAARVEDCLLQGEVAMTVWCPSNNADSQGLTLDFERNCVAAKTVIQQVIDMPPNQQLTLNARQNTLAADSILTMSMVRLFPALRNVGRSETGFRMLLERLLQVTEQQNVYSSQMQGVRRAMLSRENSLASPIATLAQWHAIWGDGIKLPTIAEVTVPTDATKPWTIAPVDGSAKRVATPLR